ncbi:MAG: DUF1569 domain-containing protein [Sphingobacteriia bacterium]|nr:MAG: DUF1569 domain-containing protein [Sphingobacteriia bacterium]
MPAQENELIDLLEQLRALTANSNALDAKISAASVGWHIDHSLLVINQIVNALKQSDPNTYTTKFNFKRWLVFNLNRLPRGKAKAPKHVIPRNEFELSVTMEQMDRAIQHILDLDQLNRDHYFQHPFFGTLNLKRTRKMLSLHTKHHLKIIHDILSN